MGVHLQQQHHSESWQCHEAPRTVGVRGQTGKEDSQTTLYIHVHQIRRNIYNVCTHVHTSWYCQWMYTMYIYMYAFDNKLVVLINHSQCICREGARAQVEGGREGGHSTPKQERNSIQPSQLHVPIDYYLFLWGRCPLSCSWWSNGGNEILLNKVSTHTQGFPTHQFATGTEVWTDPQ
jgi:hypothetical protein